MANPNAIYETVRAYHAERSAQNLSHSWKGTIPIGALIPVGLYEVLPSDIARVNSEVFCRLMPTLAPIMHEVDIYLHHFEVPFRLLMEKYAEFLYPQPNETANTIPIPPYMPANQVTNTAYRSYFAPNTLADYLGYPMVDVDTAVANSDDKRLNILPFLAYQLVYNSFFRDESLDSEVDLKPFFKGNGSTHGMADVTSDNLKAILTLRYRCWEKDYFTSAQKTAQLNGPARVEFRSSFSGNFPVQYAAPEDVEVAQQLKFLNGTAATGSLSSSGGNLSNGTNNVYLDPNGTYKVPININNVSGSFDVDTLRAMIAVQETNELAMRGGHRPNEIIPNVFGVSPDDLSINRPRYLGGGKQNLVMSEVLSHTENDEVNLGSMGGHGISYGSNNVFRHQFKEAGYVLSILSVRPRCCYGQGMEKMFGKLNRDDYAWPLYGHLGEQPVRKGELYFTFGDSKNNETFGYQPIYSDYRFKPSTIHGDLRNNLSFWHMNRLFSSRPELNSDFVHINPSDFDRNFPVNADVSSGVQLIVEVSNHAKFIRPIPSDGTPKILV